MSTDKEVILNLTVQNLDGGGGSSDGVSSDGGSLNKLRREARSLRSRTSTPDKANHSVPEVFRAKFTIQDLNVFYDGKQSLFNVSLKIPKNRVTALIGASGCGKSTLLRMLNRMNHLVPHVTHSGSILLDGIDIYDPLTDLIKLRQRVGMLFQELNPFPSSIFENVAFGPRVAGKKTRVELEELVEQALMKADLWKELKDRLEESALRLSEKEQQRLCLARLLAAKPQVILMDEPASPLDPATTEQIEDLVFDLREEYTIVIATHNVHQASRVSDLTCFFHEGAMLESGLTKEIFTCPKQKRTEDYLRGRDG